MNLGNLIAGPLLLLALFIGIIIGTMGYKLWKYTIFFIGFVQGALLGGALGLFIASTDADVHGEQAVVYMLALGLILGCMGGICFLACYFVVIFCSGCQCGIGTFLMAFLPLVAYTSPSFLTSEAGAEAVIAGCLFFGVLGGILFIKLQKLCIIMGTAFLGAAITCAPAYGVLSLSFGGTAAGDAFVEFINFAVFVLFFCVQWFKTSKGVEINPQTGEVTVVVVQQVMQPAMQTPLMMQPPQSQQPQYQLPYQPMDAAPQNGAPEGQGFRQSINTGFMVAPQAQEAAVVVAAPVEKSDGVTSSKGALPSPTSGTLDEFYAANRLEKFKPALDELGVIEVAELADVPDEELRTMGLSLVQLKRVRRQIPAAQANPGAE